MNGLGDVQTPTQALLNFSEGFLGYKPLFSGGVQIGNWTSAGGFFDINAQSVMGNICKGVAELYDNVAPEHLDPNTWTTVDDWWMPVTVNDYCMQKHVIPTWFSQSQADAYVQTAGGSFVPSQTSLVVPLAIAGGLVGLSLVLMMVKR